MLVRVGLLRILEYILLLLPEHVNIHLFGVKGAAIKKLAAFPRIVSMDSAAWDFRARMDARESKQKYSIAFRGAHMKEWYKKQG